MDSKPSSTYAQGTKTDADAFDSTPESLLGNGDDGGAVRAINMATLPIRAAYYVTIPRRGCSECSRLVKFIRIDFW